MFSVRKWLQNSKFANTFSASGPMQFIIQAPAPNQQQPSGSNPQQQRTVTVAGGVVSVPGALHGARVTPMNSATYDFVVKLYLCNWIFVILSPANSRFMVVNWCAKLVLVLFLFKILTIDVEYEVTGYVAGFGTSGWKSGQ